MQNGKPGELYRSLRDLSDHYDSAYPISSDQTAPILVSSPADKITCQIMDRIRNGVLTYSDRLELLDEAEKLGIGRFDANLIIAAVQHRHAPRAIPEPVRVIRGIRLLDVMMTFLIVQVFILFLGWIVFIR
jgi:hypothetical protein